MDAIVLSAGYGTRLRPLTEELPKPLVPVGDRPLLGHIVVRLAAAGIDRVVINTHHLPGAFAAVCREFPVECVVIEEPAIRGTAGGIAGARHLFEKEGPVLVYNGDVLAEPPVEGLCHAVGEGLCLAVAPRPQGVGTVGVDTSGAVVRLRGERFGCEVHGGDFVGVSAVGGRCLRELPERGCLIGDWALPELRRGGTIPTVPVTSEWIDAGTLTGYLAANLAWLRALGQRQWCGRNVTLSPAIELDQAVVGAGACLIGAGRVSRSVIWPGARGTAPLSDAVVTGAGRVVVGSRG